MALEKLVIHSTETPFGIEVDLESIESEHLEKGFKNIGFSDVIDFEGNIESTARLYDFKNGEKPHDWGIPNSRHIAYIGGISEDTFNIEDTRTGKRSGSNLSLGLVVDDFLGGNLNLRLVRTQGTNRPIQTEAGFTFKKKLNVPKKKKKNRRACIL